MTKEDLKKAGLLPVDLTPFQDMLASILYDELGDISPTIMSDCCNAARIHSTRLLEAAKNEILQGLKWRSVASRCVCDYDEPVLGGPGDDGRYMLLYKRRYIAVDKLFYILPKDPVTPKVEYPKEEGETTWTTTAPTTKSMS